MGRTAGIVGLGGIGQALAMRLRPFGMRLIGLQRRPEAAIAERLGMEWVGGPERLAELLRRSDYLFLCMPLSDQTRQIIDEAALATLPPQACIVNAARGGLLNHQALLRALGEGRLLGAGLDVFEQEPLESRLAAARPPRCHRHVPYRRRHRRFLSRHRARRRREHRPRSGRAGSAQLRESGGAWPLAGSRGPSTALADSLRSG